MGRRMAGNLESCSVWNTFSVPFIHKRGRQAARNFTNTVQWYSTQDTIMQCGIIISPAFQVLSQRCKESAISWSNGAAHSSRTWLPSLSMQFTESSADASAQSNISTSSIAECTLRAACAAAEMLDGCAMRLWCEEKCVDASGGGAMTMPQRLAGMRLRSS